MQSDLFEMTQQFRPAQNAQRLAFLERTKITFRLDQLLAAAIAMLILYVMVFTLGVEKGKRYATAEIKAERVKREKITEELGQKIVQVKEAYRDQLERSTVQEHAGSVRSQPFSVSPVRLTAPVATARDENTVVSGERGSEVRLGAGSKATEAKKYTIQIATYTSKGVAKEIVDKLNNKGKKGYIVSSGKYLLVCVEKFETKDMANKVLKELKSAGMAPRDAYVRNMPQGLV